MSTDSIISKVWGFCTTLRDDGFGHGSRRNGPGSVMLPEIADKFAAVPSSKPSGES